MELAIALAAAALLCLLLPRRRRSDDRENERYAAGEPRRSLTEDVPAAVFYDEDGDFDIDDEVRRRPRNTAREAVEIGPLVDYPLLLRYSNAKGEVSEREVIASSVRRRGTYSYLYGYCRRAMAFRSFRLDRILALTDMATGEVVDRPAPYIVDLAIDEKEGRNRFSR